MPSVAFDFLMPINLHLMRRFLLPLFLPSVALAVETSAGAPSAVTDPVVPELTVIERGFHHRVVEWLSQTTDESGNTLTSTNHFTEVASGLHFVDETGAWQETVAEFVPVAGGFIANRGPHQVALATDLSVAGAVTIITADR